MKPLKEYTIPFIGLKEGKHHFDYQIDKSFFEYFKYDEFNDVNVKTSLVFEKKSTLLELHFKVKGEVNINCDLTNEPFNQKLKGELDLVVKFGEEYNDEHEEILIIPHGDYEINVSQFIYELIILSMPTKRIHPGIKEGTLKSDILEKLEELSPKSLEEKETSEDIDPRWNTLKKLLTDK
ncbi:DNA-binding protein [Flavobacteriales bacterium 34_180_T64]|nr:DNA-binding protein [Flavobacteriales bacterium 34_180_T64]